MTETAKDRIRPGPLNGIKLLDLTQFLAGPFSTQIFADLGAQVIKLEAPAGDWSRTLPPHFVDEESCYYLSINRNKEAVVIDMKAPEGLALVKRLAEQCDIIMENFRPGVLDRLGLTYDDLSTRNPGLIWASISGFGQTGPYRERPAYDMIVQAMSGGMSLTGEVGRAAVRAGMPIGDLTAGMYAAIGSLAALEERRKTGKGKFVDISMLDCQVALLTYQAAYYLHSDEVPGRQGRGHESIPTYRSFAGANDTELVICANTERMWKGLCDVLGLQKLIEDDRFLTNEHRHQNREHLWPILEEAFATKEAKEWVQPLLDAGVPVGEVNTLADALSDTQVVHRQMVLDLDGGGERKARVAGNPIKFMGEDIPPHSYPPLLGEHSRKVFREVLGLSDEEFDKYHEQGIILEAGDRKSR
ncbi:MAG: carnitine dehydratase [Rhodospirillaceae bacterium]|nr:carnitine dehydratase [Rhodospirillaceae bacterium]|tara:strand:- start:3695 stop:4939 length:1245 start_codon:yes stop_codon:yes gene_type:complete